jgi:hypothetical protein
MNLLHRTMLFSILTLAIALSACAPSGAPADTMAGQEVDAMPAETEIMADSSGDEMMEEDTMPEATQEPAATEAPIQEGSVATEQVQATEAVPEIMTPEWFDISLTDVNTGESFTINDLQGNVILLETMAMWCSNCLKQQKQVRELHELLGSSEDLVSIGLDIDPNEEAPALRNYTAKQGFDWVYVISPAELSRALAEAYGNQFLNPPSTPILIIDRHGEVHPLRFGIKDAQELLAEIEPHLNQGM